MIRRTTLTPKHEAEIPAEYRRWFLPVGHLLWSAMALNVGARPVAVVADRPSLKVVVRRSYYDVIDTFDLTRHGGLADFECYTQQLDRAGDQYTVSDVTGEEIETFCREHRSYEPAVRAIGA